MQTQINHTQSEGESQERAQILAALTRWINQRPGLEPMNYGGGRDGWRAYRQESRDITRDLHQARQLLAAVSWRTSIDAAALKDALRHSYSGRLTWNGESLDYCTGQYWPTEFRRAACAVLASALWAYWRANLEDGPPPKDGKSDGDRLRETARRELGRTLANRWFR